MTTRNLVLAAAGTLAIMIASAGAQADQFPPRKPGLWQITVSVKNSAMAPMTSKYCIDANTDAKLRDMGMAASKKMCDAPHVSVHGNTTTSDSTCRVGGSVQTTHAVFSYSSDEAYTAQIKASYAPALFGRTSSETTQDAKWLGPCPAGVKPGDIIMPNGMKVNMMGGGGQQ